MSSLLYFQLKAFSTSLLTTKGCNFQNKPSNSSNFQSLKCLEKWGFQQPDSPLLSQAFDTHSSFLTANQYRFRECFFQCLVFTPQVLPKLDLSLIPNNKARSTTNTLPFFSNGFPHPHTIASLCHSRTPPSFL